MAIYGTLDGSIDLMTSSYPSIQPTLDLNFAQTKTLDPRVTFYRDSLGTYTDSSGIVRTVPANVPRFDHNPTTGESLGLLIEEQRTNLLTYSKDFSSGWSSGLTVTLNNAIAPDGTQTAALIQRPINSGNTSIDQNPSLSANTNYCYSCFIKLASAPDSTYSVCSLSSFSGLISPVYASITYNFVTGAIGTLGNLPTISGVIPYPNGWYRLYMVINTSSQTNGFLEIRPLADNSVSNFYIWGAQLEQGNFPTSYIPTSGSAVTRSADTAYMDGTNFSSWYNQSEGTFMFNYKRDFTGIVGVNFPGLLFTNSLLIFSNGSSEFIKNSNANVQLSFSGATTNFRKMYVTYSSAGYGGNLDGDAIVTGAQTLGTSDNILNLGVIQGTTIKRFSRIMYYPKRLTDTQLQNLTTL